MDYEALRNRVFHALTWTGVAGPRAPTYGIDTTADASIRRKGRDGTRVSELGIESANALTDTANFSAWAKLTCNGIPWDLPIRLF